MSAERVWFWVKVSAAVLASGYLAFLGFGAAREAASGKSGTVFDDLGERALTPADYSREHWGKTAMFFRDAAASVPKDRHP